MAPLAMADPYPAVRFSCWSQYSQGVCDRQNTAPSRRTLLAGVCALLAGCLGDDATQSATTTTEAFTQMGEIELTSPAFADGEQIPTEYGASGRNVNPPLEIAAVPADAESLALIVDDPDAVEPTGKVWEHWILWNVPPATESIPEGWTPETAQEGTNDAGTVGYSGPNPPDAVHEYRFQLFALDTTLDLPASTDADDLRAAMEGHVLAQTQLTGTYPP